MTAIVIIGLIVIILILYSNTKSTPMVKITREEETEMPFYYFCFFTPLHTAPLIRENHTITVSPSRVTIKGQGKKEVYRIQSSSHMGKDGIVYYCMDESSNLKKIFFLPSGLVSVYDEIKKEGRLFSQHYQEV